MKILFWFAICLVSTMLMSVFAPSITISDGAISALYTVSGIMFSVGMSRTVISSTVGVKNKEIRLRIRKAIKNVRNKFILCFSIVSVIYLTMELIPVYFKFFFFHVNFCWFILTSLLFSIIYYIVNFFSIQSLNDTIEDEIYKKNKYLL